MFGSDSRCSSDWNGFIAVLRDRRRRPGRASTGWPRDLTVRPLAKASDVLDAGGDAVHGADRDGLGGR